MAVHIMLIGTVKNDDYKSLWNGRRNWNPSAMKDAKKGDDVFFFAQNPVRAIVARGKVTDDAKPGSGSRDYNYRARCTVKICDHVYIDAIRQTFPGWRWHKTTQGKVTVPEAIAPKLLAMAKP